MTRASDVGEAKQRNAWAVQINCEAKFDGKDYSATGPTVPPGLTIAITKSGPRSFDMTERKDGKETIKLSLAVSADGKTLTQTGGVVGTSEKFRLSTSDSERQRGGRGAIAHRPRASRRSRHLSVSVTEGSQIEKWNDIGVWLWTDCSLVAKAAHDGANSKGR